MIQKGKRSVRGAARPGSNPKLAVARRNGTAFVFSRMRQQRDDLDRRDGEA